MSAPITAILLEDEFLRSSKEEVKDKVIEEEEENEEDEEEEKSFYVEYIAPGEEEISPPSATMEQNPEPTRASATEHATDAKTKPGKSRRIAENRNAIRLRHIPSIPNFRALLWDRQKKPVVFRSARQECLAYEDVKAFMEFDIKTIIDLRSCHEYSTTSGERLLDRIYSVFDVSLPKESANFNANEMNCTQVSYNYPDEDKAILQQFLRPEEASQNRRRLLIPICNKNYLMRLTKEVGGYHITAVRALADLATFFKFGFLTRRFVQHFNEAGQWRLYVSYLEHGANAIVAALKVIKEPENLPVLINCHVGKDRTGVLSAILLTIVGVAREDILKDFARSEEGIQQVRDQIREYMTSQKMYWAEEFLHAFPDDLLRVFEYVDEKYGSLNNFLHVQGFTYEEQARLKENLLVGSRSSFGSGSKNESARVESVKVARKGSQFSTWSQVI